ncbi:MFS transporter, partial [Xanthomonas sp. Kuri4-3]
NLPLGVLALACVWRCLPWLRPAHRGPVARTGPERGMLIVLLGSMQLLADRLGHWPASAQWGLAALALAAGLGLWAWQRRAAEPLLPPVLFGDAELRGLFVLSALAGAVMFALLFYMPLLLQAGYGYTPRQASVVLTPLVLCITLGALVNGRIVARLARPGRLPATGFALLCLACVGVAASGLRAPVALLFGCMVLAGSGLGLILMNLTLFTQAAAPREHLGIATALLQSLRLVGGMLATTVFGVLVSAYYRHGLASQLAGTAPPAWGDPQWLMEPARTERAAWPLAQARVALADAVDLSVLLLALLPVCALWCLWRMPALRLQRR